MTNVRAVGYRVVASGGPVTVLANDKGTRRYTTDFCGHLHRSRATADRCYRQRTREVA